MAKERISELEDIMKEIAKTESQKEKRTEEKPRIYQKCNYKKCNICVMIIHDGEDKREKKELFETIITDSFPKLMSDTKLHI